MGTLTIDTRPSLPAGTVSPPANSSSPLPARPSKTAFSQALSPTYILKLQELEAQKQSRTDAQEKQRLLGKESDDIVKVKWWCTVRLQYSLWAYLILISPNLQNDNLADNFRVHVERGKTSHVYFRPTDDPDLKACCRLADDTPFHSWDKDTRQWMVTFPKSPALKVRLGETLLFKHIDVTSAIDLPSSSTPLSTPTHKRQKSSLSESPIPTQRVKVGVTPQVSAMPGSSQETAFVLESEDDHELSEEEDLG